jgi:uncharacterized protein
MLLPGVPIRFMAEAGGTAWIRVEVAYALPEQQWLVPLEVRAGTTVRQAVELSGILGRFPGIETVQGGVGVFGRLVKPDSLLRDGDRVEIYRPLIADPKQARRARVRKRRG